MLLSVRSIFSMVQQFCPNYRLLLELHALTQVAHSYPLLLPLTAVILVSKLHSMTHYYNTTVIYCNILWFTVVCQVTGEFDAASLPVFRQRVPQEEGCGNHEMFLGSQPLPSSV